MLEYQYCCSSQLSEEDAYTSLSSFSLAVDQGEFCVEYNNINYTASSCQVYFNPFHVGISMYFILHRYPEWDIFSIVFDWITAVVYNVSSVDGQKGAINIERCPDWEPEGCYCCTKSVVIVPFWFATEHLWTVIVPFWLSTDNIWLCFLFLLDLDSFYTNCSRGRNVFSLAGNIIYVNDLWQK